MKIRIIEPAGLHHAGAGVPGQRCGNDLLKMRGIGIELIFICHGKGVHGRKMVIDRSPGIGRPGSVVIECGAERGLGQCGVKPYWHRGVIALGHDVGLAERAGQITGGVEAVAPVDAVCFRCAGQKIAELGGGKPWKRPEHRPKVAGMQAAQRRKVPVNGLPEGGNSHRVRQSLLLLLRHDDDKIPRSQFIYGQIEHHPGAERSIQAKIYRVVVRQLFGKQGAVHPKGCSTAAHKDQTGLIALGCQQGALGGQLPQKGAAVLCRQGKAPPRQKQRYGDKNTQHRCDDFLHKHYRIPFRIGNR